MSYKVDQVLKGNILKKGYLSFLCAILTVIIIPIHVQYLPPFIIIWCLSWILEFYSGYQSSISLNRSSKVLFILFIIYYFWQIVGMLYTEDTKLGFLNLFGRLSLLIFPILLVFPGVRIKNNINFLLRAFALSTMLFLLFCFANALFRSLSMQNGNIVFYSHPAEFTWLSYFYSAELTVNQHPTYIAMYVFLASLISFESWFDSSLGKRLRIFWLISGLILVMSQYFLSSRAGILISMILLPVYLIVKLRKNGIKKYAWLWIVLLLLVLVPLVMQNQRVDYLYGKLINKKADYERKEDPRLKIWEASFKVAKENFLFGVGIGDVRSALAEEYEKRGEEKMAKERLNAHNQFIEVLIENGIIGLLIFISIFCFMLYIAYLNKSILYLFFILMTIMFFMFETMLYRLAGVSFFGLFSFLLFNSKLSNLPGRAKEMNH